MKIAILNGSNAYARLFSEPLLIVASPVRQLTESRKQLATSDAAASIGSAPYIFLVVLLHRVTGVDALEGLFGDRERDRNASGHEWIRPGIDLKVKVDGDSAAL